MAGHGGARPGGAICLSLERLAGKAGRKASFGVSECSAGSGVDKRYRGQAGARPGSARPVVFDTAVIALAGRLR